MSWSCIKRKKKKFLWFWWGEGCWYDRREWSVENEPKKTWISRLRVQFSADKGILGHNDAQFNRKLATFLISSPAKIFTPVFWWVVWLCNSNKLKNRNCFLQIHFVTNYWDHTLWIVKLIMYVYVFQMV